MKNCTVCGRKNTMTTSTLTIKLFNTTTIVSMTAFRTHEAINPPQFIKIAEAAMIICKACLKFKNTQAMKLFLNNSKI